MKLHLKIINQTLLSFVLICLGIISGKLSAEAETIDIVKAGESTPLVATSPAALAKSKTKPILLSQVSRLQVLPSVASNQSAALLGQPLIRSNNPVTVSEFASDSALQLAQYKKPRIAQAAPRNDSSDRSAPETVPSNIPTNSTNVNSNDVESSTTMPGTTMPDMIPNTTTVPNTSAPRAIPEDTTTPISPSTTPDTTITPTQPLSPTQIVPGRSTRSGSSYVGVGGNIGIGSGDTELGQGSFAIISKIGLTQNFSVRPTVLFTDSVTILLPVTYDFNFGEGPTGDLGFSAAPYLGAGAAISTGDGADVGLLLTGGIDVPLSSQFTATASVNASVTGEAAIGILVGVGYNFR